MRGEEPDGDAEADRYAALLPERLDVTLLSMGEDGHCASLFPGSPQLAERELLCTTGLASYAPLERITLTLPALDRSRLVLILALGERKRDALARIRAGEPLPSAQVAPTDGEVVWIVDRAALGRLVDDDLNRRRLRGVAGFFVRAAASWRASSRFLTSSCASAPRAPSGMTISA